ncbi:MAG: hypothetical protein EOO87_10445 [Pedobacter sp.]|nr:MAG: hypothetical protein EOO87_10445 [Pedobacter sp.]
MKTINYQYPESSSMQIASEPEVLYLTGKNLNEFKITSFEKLNSKLPFSQAEWADILHISDRTLQRYIKDGKPFEGLYAEHLYQLENLAVMASEVFSSPETVKNWLMSSKNVLGATLDFNTLRSFWGVKLIAAELGRIAHGVYI